mmetsp:Transcript_24186/g.65513  ORF Transcript_24186/g.65513 Transcript_24186/m.65513 type:complete len:232 (-) Transcript_24186:481-1176(-)
MSSYSTRARPCAATTSPSCTCATCASRRASRAWTGKFFARAPRPRWTLNSSFAPSMSSWAAASSSARERPRALVTSRTFSRPPPRPPETVAERRDTTVPHASAPGGGDRGVPPRRAVHCVADGAGLRRPCFVGFLGSLLRRCRVCCGPATASTVDGAYRYLRYGAALHGRRPPCIQIDLRAHQHQLRSRADYGDRRGYRRVPLPGTTVVDAPRARVIAHRTMLSEGLGSRG